MSGRLLASQPRALCCIAACRGQAKAAKLWEMALEEQRGSEDVMPRLSRTC